MNVEHRTSNIERRINVFYQFKKNTEQSRLGSNIGHGFFVGWVEHPDIFCWVSFLNPTYVPAIYLLSAKPNKMAEDKTVPNKANLPFEIRLDCLPQATFGLNSCRRQAPSTSRGDRRRLRFVLKSIKRSAINIRHSMLDVRCWTFASVQARRGFI